MYIHSSSGKTNLKYDIHRISMSGRRMTTMVDEELGPQQSIHLFLH